MKRFWGVLVAGGAAVMPAFAASPDPKDLAVPPGELSRAQSLVRRLGSEAFRDREEATRELSRMGRLAKPVLQTALTDDPDPEVRARAGRLLPRAAEDDLKARVDAFLADVDGKFDHQMPGLDRFRRVVGGDKAARDLFVELVQAPPNLDLLAATGGEKAALGKAIAARRMELFAQVNPGFRGVAVPAPPKPLTLPDVAVLLFAESQIATKDIPLGDARFRINSVTFLSQPAIQTAAKGGGPHAAAFIRVMDHWLDTRTDVNELGQVLNTLSNLNYPGMARVAKRVLEGDGMQPYFKAMALTTLAKAGGKEHLPLMKAQLANDALLMQNQFNNVKVETRVQDIALAMCLVTTGQQPKEYGFELMQGFHDAVKFYYWNYGFATPDKRKAALKKFAEWEAAPPKK